MPLQRQGHLTMDEVYSLTAYLLYRNGIIQELRLQEEQTAD